MKATAGPKGPPQEAVDAVFQNLSEDLPQPEAKIKLSERLEAMETATKLAVVAVMVCGVAFGLYFLSRPAAQPTTEIVVKTIAPEREPAGKIETVVPAERAETTEVVNSKTKIEELFAAGDIEGLLTLISESDQQTKTAFANYLAKLADANSLTILEKLEQLSTAGLTKEAIVADLVKTEPLVKAELKTKDTRRLIHGWLIDHNDNPVQGQIQLGGPKVSTTENGAFTIPEPAYTEFGSVFGRAFNTDGDLGCFFIWQKSNDVNNAEIIIKPLATVSGFVVNGNGDAVNDFGCTISVVIGTNRSGENTVYQGSIGDIRWNTKVYPDGSFDINSIPTGVLLQLAIKKPGFKTDVSMENLQAGRNLDLGQITLKPLPGFSEDTSWDCTLSGFVIDEHNEPLPGARLNAYTGEERFEIECDQTGWYEFRGLPAKAPMELIVYHNGHGNNSFSFDSPDSNTELNIQMFPPAYERYDKPAPGLFVKQWLNSEPITLEDLQGQVILLYVGVEIRRNTRYIEEVQNLLDKYQQYPFTAIAICEQSYSQPGNLVKVQKFIEENEIDFPFGIDEENDIVKDMILPRNRRWSDDLIQVPRKGLRWGAMHSLYEIKANPAYYLIDKNGLLRVAPTQSNLDQWVEFLLNE